MKAIYIVISGMIVFTVCGLTACGGDEDEASQQTKKSRKHDKSNKDSLVSIFEDPNVVPYKPKSKKKLVTYTDYENAAKEALSQSAYDDALKLAKKAIELDPSSGVVHYYYGKCLMATARGENEKGFQELKKAIECGYESDDLYEYMAIYYTAKKKPKKAIEVLNKAIKLSPKKKSYYQFRGSLYLQLGDLKNAEKDYTRLTQISDRKSPTAYFKRGKFYENVGRYKEALADFKKALNYRRTNFQAQKAVARILVKLKLYKKAIVALNKVLKLYPSDDDAFRTRGECYLVMKKYKKAMADFNKAIELSPDYGRSAYLARARLYDLLGEKKKADADRSKAKTIYEKPAEKPVYDFSKDKVKLDSK